MKQLRILFLINLILYFTGASLFPLLPLYGAQFGATPAVIGIHLALIAGANAIGIALSGRLVTRVAPKPLFVAASLLGVAMLFWLAHATQLWQVMVATALLWLSGGFVYSLATLFAGLIAGDGNRGRSFGLLVLASPSGAVLGGLVVGGAIVKFGFAAAFTGLAVLWLAIPALVLLALPQTDPEGAAPQAASAPRQKTALGTPFYFMLVMGVLAAAAASVGHLSLTLSMQALRFSPQAISSTTVISGLAAIPVTFYLGSLSDRVGRRRVLMLNFVLIAVVVIGMMRAAALWHFWLGAGPLMMAGLVNSAITSALATDLLPRASLERGLPLLMAAMTMVGIPSSVGTGYLMELYGPPATFALSAVLALAAMSALALLSGTPRFRLASRTGGVFGRRLARRPA
jgi:MFS family permease